MLPPPPTNSAHNTLRYSKSTGLDFHGALVLYSPKIGKEVIGLAHHKATKKQMRQDARRRARNRAVKSEIRSVSKKVSAASSPEDAAKSLSNAASVIDKAAKKNMIHWKTAARKKSRLAKHVNASKG